MQHQHWVRALSIAASVIVAGCATAPAEPPKPAPAPVVAQPPAPPVAEPRRAPVVAVAPEAVVKPAAAPKQVSSAATVDAYKRHVAQRIAAANTASLADSLPPMLKSVVVLEISVDHEGNASDVSVRRSNGFKDLEQAAIASVRRAGKFDAPSDAVLGGQTRITYLETFLFRPDGRYQIRTLASSALYAVPAGTKKN